MLLFMFWTIPYKIRVFITNNDNIALISNAIMIYMYSVAIIRVKQKCQQN